MTENEQITTSIKDLIVASLSLENEEELLKLIKSSSFRLKYEDPVLKGELTPPYLATLSEYQESVYFAYLSINGKKEDLRYLTNEEREALSLKFKIEEGSDIIDIMSENADKLIQIIGDKMSGDQMLITIIVLLGYLSLDKVKDIISEVNDGKKDQANIEREKRLYETIDNLADRVSDSSFMEKRMEAIEKPLVAYEGNKLITDEFVVDSEDVREKEPKKTKEEIVIEGNFLVDGMTGMGSDKRTFYLIIDDEKYTVQLRKNDLDLLKTKKLIEALGKMIHAKLTIEKINGIVTKKLIENVEILEED